MVEKLQALNLLILVNSLDFLTVTQLTGKTVASENGKGRKELEMKKRHWRNRWFKSEGMEAVHTHG